MPNISLANCLLILLMSHRTLLRKVSSETLRSFCDSNPFSLRELILSSACAQFWRISLTVFSFAVNTSLNAVFPISHESCMSCSGGTFVISIPREVSICRIWD